MRIVLMGPPGAGKGTQAVVVAAQLGIAHVSTGDIFRANVAAGTPLGVEAKRFMDAGEYVPDHVTNSMIRQRLAEADCEPGFLLDGYPRTLDQVTVLDEIVGSDPLDRVVEMTVDTDELIRRLHLRALDQGRTDDNVDVIRHRMEVYVAQTEPLTAVYADRGLLVRVDGMGAVEDVTSRILAALAR